MLDIRKKLNINIDSLYWEEASEKASNDLMYPNWLTEKFLIEFDEKFGVLGECSEYILKASKQVRETEELNLFAKVLYYILEHKLPVDKEFLNVELPEKPHDEEYLGYAYVGVFPILAHMWNNYDLMIKLGADDTIISDTYNSVAICIDFSRKKSGYPCLNKLYFCWLIQYVNGDMFVIDRFEVQRIRKAEAFHIKVFKNKSGDIKILMDDINVHRSGRILGTAGCNENDGSFYAECVEYDDIYEGHAVDEKNHLVQTSKTKLSKSEWQLVFSKEDSAIGIHIPAGGAFDEETCQRSYEKIKRTLGKLFPDMNFKAFTTVTWLLSQELKEYLKENSNIRKFSEKYNVFPYTSQGLGVFSFVYNMPVKSLEEVDLEALSENTSLMRHIKQHYINGKFIYEYGGIMLI